MRLAAGAAPAPGLQEASLAGSRTRPDPAPRRSAPFHFAIPICPRRRFAALPVAAAARPSRENTGPCARGRRGADRSSDALGTASDGAGAASTPRPAAGGRLPYPARPTPTATVSTVACFSTCPDADTARRIADALVEERLAACVQLLPGLTSVYRWEDRVQASDEVLLIAKTARARLDALTARIVALHPYALPEVIAFDASGGLPAYLAWIAGQTSPGAAE